MGFLTVLALLVLLKSYIQFQRRVGGKGLSKSSNRTGKHEGWMPGPYKEEFWGNFYVIGSDI